MFYAYYPCVSRDEISLQGFFGKKKKKERAKVRGIINDKRAYNTRYTFVARFRFIIFAVAFLSRFQLSYGIHATIFYHA